MLHTRALVLACAAVLAFAVSVRAQHRSTAYDAITIPHGGATTGTSTPYPDRIRVTGVRRPISHIRVTLPFLSHSYPDDLDIVLVSPRGLAVVLMSDAGGVTPFNGRLRFEAGGAPLPDGGPLVHQTTYAPADFEPGDTPPGLPAGLTFTTLEGLSGSDANGYWSVYVYDDALGDTGQMEPPELEITEAFQGPIGIDGDDAQTPIPDFTEISRYVRVNGLDGPVHNLKVRIFGLSHTYPRDLDIGVIDPAGQTYILMSDAGGNLPVTNIDVEFGMYPTPVPFASLTSGQYAATDYTDLNPDLAGVLGTLGTEGRNGSGLWQLVILDDARSDTGSFTGWELVFDPPCAADFNRDGSWNPQDIFDYLSAWFNGCP